MYRIVHDVTTLTCALHKATTIACNNRLSAIETLHQSIQRWAKLTLPERTKPHLTTLTPMSTRQRSILRHMRRPHEDQPHDIPPRVVIQKPNASPIPTTVPSIKNQYEPVARRTMSEVPQTVDQQTPRVNKTPDTGPISRRMRLQTAALASVITPAQAAQRQYPAQFLQSLTMPVLEKTSSQSL